MTRSDVLLVSTWKTPCGIADYTATLRGALEAAGIDCEVAVIDRAAIDQMSRSELTEHFVDFSRQLSGHEIIHIQHEHGFFAGSYGLPASLPNFRTVLAAAEASARRVVVTFHSLPLAPGWPSGGWRTAMRTAQLQGLWRYRLAPRFAPDRVAGITLSRFQRRILIDSGIDRQALTLVPQTAPRPLETSADRIGPKLALGYGRDDRLLVIFGFVSAYKGHVVALRALRALPADFHLAIVGGPHPVAPDGAYEQILEMATRRSLRDRVRVTGWVDADTAARYLAAADTCLLPYLDTGLSTSAAAMAALASGRPVIASRLPAFRELADDGDCLALVSPNAPLELAEAVALLADDPDRGKRLTTNARALCLDRSPEVVTELHTQVYGIGTRASLAALHTPRALPTGRALAATASA
jgi:glycosyltransferase involved in cell wall biosynthesis